MIKAKKSLGQNFLIDLNVIKKIVSATEIKNKTILEVGPGTGNLTNGILEKKPKKVYVVEKDEKLVEQLEKKKINKLVIINDDILKIDETNLFNEKVIVFGNLPYNISTEILRKWIVKINNNFWFECLILMFQKEVADRIIAKFNTSNYGRLAILSNWKLKISKICDVKPNSFFPKPKIESSVLSFFPKKDFVQITNPEKLEVLTRTFFNHRRKMIKKPFNQLFNGNQKLLERLKIDLSLRPQNIDFDQYYQLALEYERLTS